MLKKTIKHKDLEGNDVETDAYFNLTKAEAIELRIRNDLDVIGRSRDKNETMDAFKRILQMSYGVKTGDGRFIKVNNYGTPLFYEFMTTEAYSELFIEIFSNEGYAVDFIKSILPAEAVAAMDEQTAQESKSDIPPNLANHPSMQGHKAPEARPDIPGQTSIRPGETPEEMEARIRRQLLQEMAPQTPPAQVSLTPAEAQQPGEPNRDQLI